MKTRIILFLSLATILLSGYAISPFLPNINPVVLSLIILFLSLNVRWQKGSLYTALDVSALEAALGAYFRKDKDTLFTKIMLGMDIDDRFDVWDDCADEVPMPGLDIEDIVQPGADKDFNPTPDALKFGARKLKVRDWKVDLKIRPTTLHKTWLAKYKKKGSDVFQLPFEEFVFATILKKAQQNIRFKALYKGVYDANGTEPEDIFNGLDTIVIAERTAGNLVGVATGALAQNTIIDQIYAVYDNLGEEYKGVPTIMPVSPTVFDWYVRKDKALYGANTNQEKMQRLAVQIDGTLCTLLREPGRSGSQLLYVTTPDNAVYGVDSLADSNKIEIQKEKRDLILMIDAKAGVDFKQVDADCLSCNDQN